MRPIRHRISDQRQSSEDYFLDTMIQFLEGMHTFLKVAHWRSRNHNVKKLIPLSQRRQNFQSDHATRVRMQGVSLGPFSYRAFVLSMMRTDLCTTDDPQKDALYSACYKLSV